MKLSRWFAPRGRAQGRPPSRSVSQLETGLRSLSLVAAPAVTYAVGDIHGRLDLYRILEDIILADAADTCGDNQPFLIVLLGDVIDRGPHSAELIDHLLAPPPEGSTRVTLMGNHEDAFRSFLRDPEAGRAWLSWGGTQTLASYGIHPSAGSTYDTTSGKRFAQMLEANVPASHRAFLDTLPICLDMPDWFLSHSGVDPLRPLSKQRKTDLMWSNPARMADHTLEKTVIHGHVIVDGPTVSGNTVNVDTGAYKTGVLTCARLVPGEDITFLTATGAALRTDT